MQRAWVISTGTELALGQTLDTNTAWVASRLAAVGVRTTRHITVGDDLEETCDVLRAATGSSDAPPARTGRCDVVVLTGGLGPTEDDLVRQALATVAGVPMDLHAESLERIRAFFAARGRPMHDANRVQALLPRGATALPNPRGTAPGILLRLGETPVFSLPGVPFEMREMFEREVLPRIAAASAGRALLSRRLHAFGAGESVVGGELRDLMARGRNPEVGTTAQLGVVGIRINVEAETSAEAHAMLDETEREIRRRLGAIVYGRDEETLAGVVGGLLLARRATIAVAESCTGGWIGTLLTEIVGASAWFRGGVIAYANEAKTALLSVAADQLAQHGAVSSAVARAMATGVRVRLDATFGLSVTGIAGPGGGSAEKPVGLVYVGLADGAGASAEELRLGADAPREVIRDRAAKAALNLVRLRLLQTGG
ncbi:MAG: competence/damage-inducible protein A [Phycisphaerae bacterium]